MRFFYNQPIICYFEPFLNFGTLHLFGSKGLILSQSLNGSHLFSLGSRLKDL